MDVMDEDSFDFVQLCALLGSFYLYHDRPRSSFPILELQQTVLWS